MKNTFLYSNSKTVTFVNPINDQDKTLYKDVSNIIKTAINYPPKLALDKISCVIFFLIWNKYKENIDNFGQVVLLFDINFK